jgi:hypothetical protein
MEHKMDSDKSYWVVEYRFPIQVEQALTPKEAQLLASSKFEKEYGFKPSGWFARVFEYGPSVDEVGPLKEYFFNPSGASYRELDKNDDSHGRKVHEKVVDAKDE